MGGGLPTGRKDKESMLNNHKVLRFVLIVVASCVGLVLVGAYPAFLFGKFAFNRHFEKWGEKLVDLERRDLLSKAYGAGWLDVLAEDAMNNVAAAITDKEVADTAHSNASIQVVDGITLADYPSLSIIKRLRAVRTYSNTIEIVDRLERPLSSIRTDHQRSRINEFPPTLITALLAAEDKNFRENNFGFEFDSFTRAALRSILESITSRKKVTPRGTSTITQQVAKLFISRLDERGFRFVNKSIGRKVRELRLAVALRKLYSPDDVLEVYLNHCVTSDNGMIGYTDIAQGLFNKNVSELSDPECIYLARMVKWGRNIRSKIIRQCAIDMPRMGAALHWNAEKQRVVLAALDTITFKKSRRFQGDYGSLVDLANEYWLKVIRKNGVSPEQLEDMNVIDPNSLVRRKGNLRIKLSIDVALQKELERLVNARGYGRDTTILAEVRIGSIGKAVSLARQPKDTLRMLQVLQQAVDFHEPGSSFITTLDVGDSVYVNIRYTRIAKTNYRRSSFFYVKRPVVVDGQYYAYAIMNARSGKLMAYYSKDRLGSRLACLLQNRTQSGSSTIKPICNALNFDLGIFKPFEKWDDSLEIHDDVPWKRTFDVERGKVTGVVFEHSAVRGRGYPVHNHNDVFEGCNYIFDHLSSSNNILGVETMYRLNRTLFTPEGEIAPGAFPEVQFFSRIGAFARVKDSLKMRSTTGVRVIKELARIVGVDIDSTISFGKRVPLSDSMYSVALGTLEMNLYEQMHLYNVLYNNDIIERPADHPSLVIEAIVLNGDTVALNDTIRRFHPFSDINMIRPTLLGMHKRLVSNGADGLAGYDVAYYPMPMSLPPADTGFSFDEFTIDSPVANFSKSGTTDDVIRPFNVDATSNVRTNYGIWNAAVRVDLSQFSGSGPEEITDLAISCIGECNSKYTGPRDGKTLHKFLTVGLLKKAGIKVDNGFFTQYERYLKRVTPDSALTCNADSVSNELDATGFGDGSDEARNRLLKRSFAADSLSHW